MIDLIDVLQDSDLCSAWQIQRNSGYDGAGGWVSNPPQTVQMFGAARVATAREIMAVPAADQVHEMLSFYSTQPIYVTDAARGGTSDVIVFQGGQYRVLSVQNFSEQGFYVATAARMAGA
jgi:hypothetical protein